MSIFKHHVGDWKEERASRRPYIKEAKCCVCKQPFPMHKRWGWKGTKAMVRETQHTCMRGDDTVEFAHKRCLEHSHSLTTLKGDSE